jgi:hypothetical protein
LTEIISKGGLSKRDIDVTKNITLEHANYLGMPVRYPAVYRKNERDEVLAKITVDDIFSELADCKFLLLE